MHQAESPAVPVVQGEVGNTVVSISVLYLSREEGDIVLVGFHQCIQLIEEHFHALLTAYTHHSVNDTHI